MQVGRGRDREADVQAEREAEVVGRDDVGRVGDGDEHEVLVDEADGQRVIAARELLGQEVGGGRLELRLGEVDELEAVLLREPAGDVLRLRPAAVDDDLA